MSQDMGHDEEETSKCAVSMQEKHCDDDVLLALSLGNGVRCNFMAWQVIFLEFKDQRSRPQLHCKRPNAVLQLSTQAIYAPLSSLITSLWFSENA
jgi:hypothetical protein